MSDSLVNSYGGSMKVKQMRDFLETLPDDAEIVVVGGPLKELSIIIDSFIQDNGEGVMISTLILPPTED